MLSFSCFWSETIKKRIFSEKIVFSVDSGRLLVYNKYVCTFCGGGQKPSLFESNIMKRKV